MKLSGVLYSNKGKKDEKKELVVVMLSTGIIQPIETLDEHIFDFADIDDMSIIVDGMRGEEIIGSVIGCNDDLNGTYFIIDGSAMFRIWSEYSNGKTEKVFLTVNKNYGEYRSEVNYAKIKPFVADPDRFAMAELLQFYNANEIIDDEIELNNGVTISASAYVIPEDEYKVLWKHLMNGGQ